MSNLPTMHWMITLEANTRLSIVEFQNKLYLKRVDDLDWFQNAVGAYSPQL